MAAGTPSSRYYKATDEVEKAEYDGRWDKIWQDKAAEGTGEKPGWDIGGPSRSLLALLQSPEGAVAGKKVLVPGCGSGYDLLSFAQHGAAEVVGVEIAPTALAVAQGVIKAAQDSGLVAADGSSAGPSMSVVRGDFFKWEQQHDLGFDYTFGCAMHPTLREQWAASWAKAIRPGGELWTLVWPSDPARDPTTGPPFTISVDLFRSLLGPAGFELLSEQRVPDELAPPRARGPGMGAEFMCRWRRQ